MSLNTGDAVLAFVKPETVDGTLAVPVATDVLRLTGYPDINQPPNVVDNEEKILSYSKFKPLKTRYSAGEASGVECYMKRTGTNNTEVPYLTTILTALFGRRTAGGASVTYNLSQRTTTEHTCSLWYQFGDEVIQVAGWSLDKGEFPIQATPDGAGIFKGKFAGKFFRMYRAGYSVLSADLTASGVGLDKFQVAAADVGKFDIGAYISAGNSPDGTAHKITAFDNVDKFTVDPVFGGNKLAGEKVCGYLPTPTDAGYTVEGYKGNFEEPSGTNFVITGATVVVENAFKVLDDEKNGSAYPSARMRSGRRSIRIEGVKAYFDAVDRDHDLLHYKADQLTATVVKITMGDTAGSIFEFNFPQTILAQPKFVGGDLLTCEHTVEAYASASMDDELNLVSK